MPGPPVKRSEWRQLTQCGNDVVVDEQGPSMTRAAVNHAVSTACGSGRRSLPSRSRSSSTSASASRRRVDRLRSQFFAVRVERRLGLDEPAFSASTTCPIMVRTMSSRGPPACPRDVYAVHVVMFEHLRGVLNELRCAAGSAGTGDCFAGEG